MIVILAVCIALTIGAIITGTILWAILKGFAQGAKDAWRYWDVRRKYKL